MSTLEGYVESFGTYPKNRNQKLRDMIKFEFYHVYHSGSKVEKT